MKISLDKKYKTRDGREVKLLMVDGGTEWPIIGAFKKNDEYWVHNRWTREGRDSHVCTNDRDLIEIKPHIKLEKWININRSANKDGAAIGGAYSTKEDADNCLNRDRIACVKITIDCEEGEGLKEEK